MPRPPISAPRSPGNAAPALMRWPSPPKDFTAGERAEWKRLGKAAMAARMVTEADLLMAERYARIMARLSRMYRNTKSRESTIAALERLGKEILVQLGLTPFSRKSVQAPAAPKGDDPEDPLSEF